MKRESAPNSRALSVICRSADWGGREGGSVTSTIFNHARQKCVANNIIVEPLNKGHYGTNDFVPCREVVPISESPLLEVPL